MHWRAGKYSSDVSEWATHAHAALVDGELADGLVVRGAAHLEHGEPTLHLAEHLDVAQQDDGVREREYMIIREEVERVVRRSVPPEGPLQTADAVATVSRFVDQAEFIGVRLLEKEREE